MKNMKKRDRNKTHTEAKKHSVSVCYSEREKERKAWRDGEVGRAVLSVPSTLIPKVHFC